MRENTSNGALKQEMGQAGTEQDVMAGSCFSATEHSECHIRDTVCSQRKIKLALHTIRTGYIKYEKKNTLKMVLKSFVIINQMPWYNFTLSWRAITMFGKVANWKSTK
jgi:hypothetical protein